MPAIDKINQDGTTYEIVPEIAELFSTTKAYHTGDHVIYEAGWYTFKADKTVGAWDATKVDGPFKVSDQLSDLKEDFTDMVNSTYVTDSASGSVAHFTDGADNIPMKSVKVLLEPIQSGSGDASPSNVRPISGHSGTVKVTRAGKNLAQPLSKTESGLTLTPQADGSLKINGTFSGATGWFVISKNFLVKANQAYALSISGTTNTFGLNGFGSANPVTPTADFTTNLRLRIENGQTFSNVVIRPQVEVGTSATDFEPYIDSTSYDISLASAGTVYGGTLDAVSGVLTVDKGFVTLDGTQTIANRNWRANSNSVGWLYPYSVTQNVVPNSSAEVPDVISNRVKTASYSEAYNGTENNCVSLVYDTSKTYGLAVRYDNTLLTTDAAINAFLAENPIQVVYSLATPVTYNLTPTEVKSLLGVNNVWSDAGDVEVEYRADTKLYIKRLTGSDTDMVADANITSGQYFMVGNDLYKATVNIASGAQIVVGTNATKVSLSEALNQIKEA